MPAHQDDKKPSRAPAVNRAIRVIRRIAEAREPIGVNTIARDLGIVPSTCLHVLRALEEEGIIICDAQSRRYSLGLGLITLARSALNAGVPAALLTREIEQIATEFGASTVATRIEREDRMVIVAAARAQASFGVHFDVGRRFPAYISATGRCFAAYSGLNRAELKQKFDPLTWDDPPSFDEWLGEVDLARREGFGIDRNRYVRGYVIVAIPILEGSRMEGSIAVITANGQLSPERLKTLQETLLVLGRKLSS